MPRTPSGGLYASGFVTPTLLDRALFTSPFIVIDEANRSRHVAHSAQEAIRLLATDEHARSVVGTLRPSTVAVDIDPSDTGSEAEAGEAVADDLVQWANTLGLPWLRRASGRDGHFHIILRLPQSLSDEFGTIVRRCATHHDVCTTVRRTLRLTGAGHRLRLSCPILDSTLEASDLAQPIKQSDPVTRPQRPRTRPKVTARGHSRSENEYGHALALVRAGSPTNTAWLNANQPGSKAREIGRHAWRRWFWAPATTIVAAEQGLPEEEAWQQFVAASPTQAAHLGRTRWRATRWLPALSEASRQRPRRRRLLSPAAAQTELPVLTRPAMSLTEARTTLRTAAERLRPLCGIRMSSLVAALDALAEAIVDSRGAISIRNWAERARLDPKTIRRARDVSVQYELIRQVRPYRGGSADSDHWALADRLEMRSRPAPSPTSPTRYTPSYGNADTDSMRARHSAERTAWRRRLAERGVAMKPAIIFQRQKITSAVESADTRERSRQPHVRSRNSPHQPTRVRPQSPPPAHSLFHRYPSARPRVPERLSRQPERSALRSGKHVEDRPP